MTDSVNKVVLLGNVGNDPQIHVLRSGTVANVRLATTKPDIDNRGNRYERTEWHNVVGRGRHVGIFRDFVRRGSKIFVLGELCTRSWDDDQSGEKRYWTEVLVLELSLLSYPTESHLPQGATGYYLNRNSDVHDKYVALPEITQEMVPY